MKIADILATASMPLASPTYPKGPYRFIDRQYMIITYESDPEAIRAAVPEPLEPDGSNTVLSGRHFVADLTLPYGRVLHDYLEEATFHHPPVAARHPPRGRESAPFGRPGGGALG